MTQNKIKINTKRKSLIRVIHNRENPFVQLNKKALWDEELSLRASGLWARCLSRPDNWEFNMSELVKSCKEGKHVVFNTMKEIISAGYGMRIQHLVKKNGRIEESGIHYFFFEFKATEEEKLEQLKQFKDFFWKSDYWEPNYWNPNFKDSSMWITTDRQLLIHILTEKERDKEIYNSSNSSFENEEEEKRGGSELSTPPPLKEKEAAKAESTDVDGVDVCDSKKKKSKSVKEFSPLVREVSKKMIDICTRCNPTYRPPDKIEKFYEHVELMIEKDKQDVNVLLKTFEWACSDNEKRGTFTGWQSFIITNNKGRKPTNPAEIFREKFSSLHSQMKSRTPRKYAACSDDNEAAEMFKSMNENAI